MKYVFVFLLASFAGIVATAQMPTMADIEKMQKMSPAELEAYKQKLMKQVGQQAKQLSDKGGIKLNDMLLPDFKVEMPPKDLKRLQLIPKQPPTLIQLGDMLRTTKTQIANFAKPEITIEVKKVIESVKPEELSDAAVGTFYADKPEQSVLLGIEAALKMPNDPTAWNNLAAIMNMTGMEHKAIPILMNQLQNDPNNSMMLNNLGQGYLGLGEIGMAEMFLKQCLQNDPLNPEANRSMGMIKFFYEKFEEGMRYFEKELEIAYRRSTMCLMRSKNSALNIYKLRKKRNIPTTDYFGNLQMSKFKVPALPSKTDETAEARIHLEAFETSVLNELMFWDSKANQGQDESKDGGQRYAGLYFYYVQDLLQDLHKVYTSEELNYFTKLDINALKQIISDYDEKMKAAKCPPAPPGATWDEMAAYDKKCCDIQKRVMDAFMNDYNSFVTKRGKRVLGAWNEYLNDLINIVSLDPSPGNKVTVYRTLQQYCSILAYTYGGKLLDPPLECNTKLTDAQADSLIESARNLDLSCPKWLNVEIDVKVAKIKADCEKYAVEAGKFYQASYERNFRTGTTTLAAGVGVKAKFFGDMGGADLKAMAYVSFDKNNEFSDAGIMGKASVKIGDTPFSFGNGKGGGTLGGTEGMVKLGVNSGFTSGVKGTGALAEVVKIDKSL